MNKHSRRDVLRGVTTLAGVGTLAGCSQLSPVGGTEATIDVQANADDVTITGSSPSGTVSDVTLTVAVTVEWSNVASGERIAVPVFVQAENDADGDWSIVDPAEFSPDTSQPVSFEQEIAVLDYYSAETLSATEEDTTVTTDVPVRVEAHADNASGETVSDSVERTVTVKVTNEPGNGNGDASITATVNVSGTVEME